MYSFTSLWAFHASVPPYLATDKDNPRQLSLLLRTRKEAGVSNVFVCTAPEGEGIATEARRTDPEFEPMLQRSAAYASDWEWWKVRIEIGAEHTGYKFRLVTEQGHFFLNARGIIRGTPLDKYDFKYNFSDNPPEWVRDSVVYQIFPDRFCCGDPETNVKDGEYELVGQPVKAFAWDEPLDTACGNRSFYGGDLPGIVKKLDYLQDLGVTALYINPIFTSPSNHKYDVADYFNVDPHFGGNEALAELRKETRRRGMRLIIDFVPNHCGNRNDWFVKACEDKQSPERSFFKFHNDNNSDYERWLGVGTLPRLNYRSRELRRRMYGNRNSALRVWLREPYSLDGWRLDVANMLARYKFCDLGHEVGREMRKAVKRQKAQCWLLAENFFDYSDYEQGDEFDAVMNYRGFCLPCLQWMAGRDYKAFEGHPGGDPCPLPTADFACQLQSFRSSVPESIALNMLNLLGSHDTPRLMTMNRNARRKVEALFILMFAYQGVPHVYYGDENGMEGGGDPDCRRPMNWNAENWDTELHELVKKLCSLRKEVNALRRGSLQWLCASGDSIAFVRDDGVRRAVCTVCRATASEETLLEAAAADSASALPVKPAGDSAVALAEVSVKAACIPENTVFVGAVSGIRTVVSGGVIKALPMGLGAEIWLEELPQPSAGLDD